jgi:hypothetical protein
MRGKPLIDPHFLAGELLDNHYQIESLPGIGGMGAQQVAVPDAHGYQVMKSFIPRGSR